MVLTLQYDALRRRTPTRTTSSCASLGAEPPREPRPSASGDLPINRGYVLDKSAVLRTMTCWINPHSTKSAFYTVGRSPGHTVPQTASVCPIYRRTFHRKGTLPRGQLTRYGKDVLCRAVALETGWGAINRVPTPVPSAESAQLLASSSRTACRADRRSSGARRCGRWPSARPLAVGCSRSLSPGRRGKRHPGQ